MAQATLDERAREAMKLLQLGRPDEAVAICRGILAENDRYFHALHLLGIACLQRGTHEEASNWLSLAIRADGRQAAAHCNLAVALLGLKRTAEALKACDRALALDARLAGAHLNRGHAQAALGRIDEACASYGRAVSLAPRDPDARLGLGNAEYARGRYAEAFAAIRAGLDLHRSSAHLHEAMGRTLLRLRQPEDALRHLDEAVRLAPGLAAAHNGRGSALRALNRRAEAEQSYRQALALEPGSTDIIVNIANLLLNAGRAADAAALCAQAPSDGAEAVDLLNVRAHALKTLNRNAEATADFARLVALDPDYPYALGNLLHARAATCDWTDYERNVALACAGVRKGRAVITPMALLAVSGDPLLQLACARLAAIERFGPGAVRAPRAPRAPARSADRLRVAYLSSDFSDHPVAHLLVGVLEHHDRDRFEVHGLASGPLGHAGRAMRERICAAVEHFVDVFGMSDAALATLIEQAGIDILVDLNGHTRHGRLGVLARRPAPIQVNYLGFTGTTGAPYVDYVIGDPIALPEALEVAFSERAVRLPYTFLPNDDRQQVPSDAPSRVAAGLPEGAFVFCAFNNPYKINPPVFDLWMRILRDVPDSVLWLKGGEDALTDNLKHEAAARGVASHRLVFAGRVADMGEHLARYHLADLFLDSAPYGAHATSRDALWAGLPVLTCRGPAFASRVAASLLTALGLGTLITDSLEEYAARAAALANDGAELLALRKTLAERRLASPAFRTEPYTRALEAAYVAMLEAGGA